ncbi:hypothetical protein JWJ90_03140 [Desulfobulbus rhabdoformis]|uniref:hypothetical protein n=1 Tax=Desulfobulbus rhabdoformis TaxID=34032 RepID=UPI0019630448|nr:hypothetical protein [Desulfobulbus rhabdoformis]MBM9613276.1 hypothetical protein [Desulfobulbus rhabdoformis]
MQDYFERTLAEVVPGVDWHVGRVHLQFPLALGVDDLKGDRGQHATQASIELKHLTLWPDWDASIRKKRFCSGYTFNIQSGIVQGQMCWQKTNRVVQILGSMEGVSLQSMPLFAGWLGRSLQGTVNASFEGNVYSRADCSWKMQCRVEEGELALLHPILRHQKLPFSQVRMLVSGTGNSVRITEGRIASILGDGWFNGSVQLVRPFLQSQLQLRGGLSPEPLFFQGIKASPVLSELQEIFEEEPLTFDLSGTVQSPAIHFENLAMQIYALDKERE